MKLSLVNLVPLKEAGMGNSESLARRFKLSQLQKMLDDAFAEQEAYAGQTPPGKEFDGNAFSNMDLGGYSMNDLQQAIDLKGPKKDVPYPVATGEMTQDEYDKMMSTVKPDRASFEKSSKFDRMKETDYADRLANSGTDSDGRNTWGDKTGYSDEEMAQGKGKLKKYPDKDGRNVWGDKVAYSDAEKKAKGLNEAKITKKEFDEIASAEQKAMEKKWDSLVTNIALSKSDPKKFTANMEAKQEYLTTLNKAGKLKKDYTADKIENWSTHDNLPGWKVANIVLTTPKSTNEGSCGYGPDGVPGNTPGETKGMNADDRTRIMLRKLIQKEIAKHENK